MLLQESAFSSVHPVALDIAGSGGSSTRDFSLRDPVIQRIHDCGRHSTDVILCHPPPLPLKTSQNRLATMQSLHLRDSRLGQTEIDVL